MLCWYCYWGWPRAVRDIYDRAERDIDAILANAAARADGDWPEPQSGMHALHFGPAHVVWEDENWDCAEGCLKDCDDPQWSGWVPGVLDVVRRSLRELDALPEAARDVEPADYDGLHPEDYPPPGGVEMVRESERPAPSEDVELVGGAADGHRHQVPASCHTLTMGTHPGCPVSRDSGGRTADGLRVFRQGMR